uniref:Uncharacterized protein n=1 Tax=Chromera velia CCMP2878 TaxID=1169474 RepID=A0A0G4I1V5_9ALVE|eukprot:Cvel_10227.t1-p1 / transcript=Cvel_10227.t1 / gene=Cvel_10227 / organism=Chromera_velia_CCMP2878 / gene_product=hypothetical protein / transcript_product=hypothetical protein / location=Cvel_scaffold612:64491-65729(-) / protein_length=261 / sequence_SO=supercontig / SO=protein_coding / is_pseudo=false
MDINYFRVKPTEDSLVLFRYEVVFTDRNAIKSQRRQTLKTGLRETGNADLLVGWNGEETLISMRNKVEVIDADAAHGMRFSIIPAVLFALNIILQGATTFNQRQVEDLRAPVVCTRRGRVFFQNAEDATFPLEIEGQRVERYGTVGWRGFKMGIGLTGDRDPTKKPDLSLCLNSCVGLAYRPGQTAREFFECLLRRERAKRGQPDSEGNFDLEGMTEEEEDRLSRVSEVKGLKIRGKGQRAEQTFFKLHVSKRAADYTFQR